MAEYVLTDFIRALRSADIRVSTGEAIDAARTVDLVGFANRTRLKESLRCTLAKSTVEKSEFDRLFDLYFRRDVPEATTEEEADNAPLDQTAGTAADDALPDLLDLVTRNDEAEIAVALERAGEAAGVRDIRFSTQVAYYAQQMLQALGVDRLERDMMQAFKNRTENDTARAEALIEARKAMQGRARKYAQQAFDTYGAGATLAFREDMLSEQALTTLELRDMDRMRVLIQKIAKRLAVKHSRRRRKTQYGQLDVRRTLRANAGLGGVPFELIWKQTKRDKPKIVALCDVSGSVARTVRFFLMLLYSLEDVIPDIETFAFSGRLEPVGHLLRDQDTAGAMKQILNTIGMSSTDYGQSLSDLRLNHWDALDRRTTLIIIGDGRSNHGDPRLDLFREATARVKRTIWLTPEGESLWGSGDSELLRYQPLCQSMGTVSTVKDLERTLDDALSRYS